MKFRRLYKGDSVRKRLIDLSPMDMVKSFLRSKSFILRDTEVAYEKTCGGYVYQERGKKERGGVIYVSADAEELIWCQYEWGMLVEKGIFVCV